ANYDHGRVPGAPHWHLAPIEMAWEGLSLGQICEQIKDPARNGGRDLAAIVSHMEDDPLVAWGWAPGADREPAPGDQTTFAGLIAAWVIAGAACPE
ncbi:MAG: Isoquinoline 1-oxidoreductase subunit, partial [Acidobacteriota bacterium]